MQQKSSRREEGEERSGEEGERRSRVPISRSDQIINKRIIN
jgi:hypothetical protein